MLFNSHIFLFAFLPVTFLVFFALGRGGRREMALAWLTAASLFFYGWWDPRNVVIIAGSMIGNFALGRAIWNPQIGLLARRGILAVSIAANLALLGYYKYANFFVANLNTIAGTDFVLHEIVLPLGISFFTFQQISYLVDAYRGQTREHSFLSYCLFVTFFPQLIAGPIVHHGEMLPQFARPTVFRPSSRNVEIGLAIFSIGLFKKTVLADGVAAYSSPVFAAAEAGDALTCLEAWCGGIAFSLQVYFDFSGYSDMAIGLGRMFGIRLPLNFHSPYKAHNIIEFWRRWHLTLSRFLRDYVYIPLGGSRCGAVRRHVNICLTMLVAGLWHGAGWTYVVWGGMQGLYLFVNHEWQAFCKRTQPEPRPPSAWTRIISTGLTFVAVVASMVVFRAASLSSAGSMLWAMAGARGFVLPEQYVAPVSHVPGLAQWLASLGLRFEPLAHFHGGADLLTLAGLLCVVWFAPNTQQIMQRYKPAYEPFPGEAWGRFPARLQWRRTSGWAMATSALTLAAVLHLARISEFLYFQF